MADKKTYYAAARHQQVYGTDDFFVYHGIVSAYADNDTVQTGLTGRYKLYKVTLEEVRVPRTWDNLEDVPIDVAVTDSDGDRIFRSGNRYVYESGDNTLHCYGDPSREVPFTEILED